MFTPDLTGLFIRTRYFTKQRYILFALNVTHILVG